MRHFRFGFLACVGIYGVLSSGCTPTERNFGGGGSGGGSGGAAGSGGADPAGSSSSSSGNAGAGGMGMCAASTADCDNNGTCETNLLGDVDHCGACNTPCVPPKGGTSSCVAGKCEIVCGPGTADCDQNPATECQDLSSDSKNCGACGRDCLGGVCDLGECQPVIVLNTNIASPSKLASLVVFNNEFYWGTEGVEVVKAAIDGSASTVLATVNGGGGVYGLAVTPQAVYATNGTRVTIISHQGGTIWQSVNDGGVNHVAANDSFVVWTSTGNNKIRQADALGGNQKDFGNIEPGPTSIVLEGTIARWTNSITGDIREGSLLNTNNVSTLYGGFADADFLLQDGSTLYWYGSNTLWRANPGMKEEAIVPLISPIRALAVDNQYIYWIYGQFGEVWRASKVPPFETKLVAKAQVDPVALAIGPGALYWGNRGNGTIMRWARLP